MGLHNFSVVFLLLDQHYLLPHVGIAGCLLISHRTHGKSKLSLLEVIIAHDCPEQANGVH